jgi:hypothetical protein
MKTTRKKLLANRQNAQKSTGARTPEGKAAIAANARTHGLTSVFAVLPHEDQSEFDRMLESYRKEFNPQTEHASFLVQQLTESRWRLERIRRLEAIAFEYLALEDDPAPGQHSSQETPDLRATKAGSPLSAWATTPDARIVARMAAKTGDPLPLLNRYAVDAERSYYRAHRELSQIESRAKRNEANEAQVWLKEQLQQIPPPPIPDLDGRLTANIPDIFTDPRLSRSYSDPSGRAIPVSWHPNAGGPGRR